MKKPAINMEFRGIVVSIWCIFVLFLLNSSSASIRLGREYVDRQALYAFKAGIQDPDGSLISWNEDIHHCKWQGVTCGRKHARVKILDLQSSGLKGCLSPFVGNLSFLRKLDLRNNSLAEGIPREIGRLFRLQSLRLDRNLFTRTIPDDIGLLSKLEVLGFCSNRLVGEIPPSLGNLRKLTFLALCMNSLTGTVPSSIYKLSSITYFGIHVNKIHGTLPHGLGHSIFPYLESFIVHTNQFSGQVPITLSNASRLSEVDISQNGFYGEVPSLSMNLTWLTLFGNHFGSNAEGDLDFLSSLVNCKNLAVLDFSDNNFGGLLPQTVGNLSTKLTQLIGGGNHIRGNIPIAIGNLIGLEVLDLESNLLTGKIPNSVGQLCKLHVLFLNLNGLSGTIPSSLGNLSLVTDLSLRSNKLHGIIPESIGECKNLVFLLLSENNLSGPIPKQVIGLSSLSQALDLSRNQLTGSIPMEVGNSVNLRSLDLSENRLSGEIPQILGSCIGLFGLYLNGNQLEGAIPETLHSLRSVEELDLSHNKLSGQIPEYWETFPFLRILNLSFNELEGPVPTQGVFQNTSAYFVEENPKLCGGVPQLKLPACISTHLRGGLSLRLKVIISIMCGVVGLLMLLLSIKLLLRSRKAVQLTSGTIEPSVAILQVSYGDLVKATDGFSPANFIGAGSFGQVYKGILYQPEQREVAVKVLNLHIPRASRSFLAECEVLKTVRHRNLVKLLTACSSINIQGDDFKALVYEFMSNISLDKWLHSSDQRLDLIQMVQIAIDVASALEYLHSHCDVPIVHCDLKPSNVLLDDDMTACVGDFGLAKLLNANSASTSNAIRGSIGYTAPEYGMGMGVSTNGDIYSYGILLLEMLTGKRPTDDMFKDGLNLHNFVLTALPEHVEEVCDPILLQREQRRSIKDCLVSIATTGVSCSMDSPEKRMDIRTVVSQLCAIKDELVRTRRPKDQPGSSSSQRPGQNQFMREHLEPIIEEELLSEQLDTIEKVKQMVIPIMMESDEIVRRAKGSCIVHVWTGKHDSSLF